MRRALRGRLGRRRTALAGHGIGGGICCCGLAGLTVAIGFGQMRWAASAATPPAWPLSGVAGYG